MKLNLFGYYIFEHYSKLLFEWVLETVISTRLKSTHFILQACFRGEVTDVIWIINSKTCRFVKRKNNPLHILVNYERVLFPSSSVGRLNKHNEWCCDSQVFFKPTREIRPIKRKYTSTIIGKKSLQFQFLHHGSFVIHLARDLTVYL